jgi:hypothetical protein
MESLEIEQAIMISHIAELTELCLLLDGKNEVILRAKIITRLQEQSEKLANMPKKP